MQRGVTILGFYADIPEETKASYAAKWKSKCDKLMLQCYALTNAGLGHTLSQIP